MAPARILSIALVLVLATAALPLAEASGELPDLRVTNLQWAPLLPYPGERVAVAVEVGNAGATEVPAFTLRILIDGETLHEAALGPLAPGERATTRAAFVAKEGEHEIRVAVDAENAVAESDETNNEYAERFAASAEKLAFDAASYAEGVLANTGREDLPPRPAILRLIDGVRAYAGERVRAASAPLHGLVDRLLGREAAILAGVDARLAETRGAVLDAIVDANVNVDRATAEATAARRDLLETRGVVLDAIVDASVNGERNAEAILARIEGLDARSNASLDAAIAVVRSEGAATRERVADAETRLAEAASLAAQEARAQGELTRDALDASEATLLASDALTRDAVAEEATSTRRTLVGEIEASRESLLASDAATRSTLAEAASGLSRVAREEGEATRARVASATGATLDAIGDARADLAAANDAQTATLAREAEATRETVRESERGLLGSLATLRETLLSALRGLDARVSALLADLRAAVAGEARETRARLNETHAEDLAETRAAKREVIANATAETRAARDALLAQTARKTVEITLRPATAPPALGERAVFALLSLDGAPVAADTLTVSLDGKRVSATVRALETGLYEIRLPVPLAGEHALLVRAAAGGFSGSALALL